MDIVALLAYLAAGAFSGLLAGIFGVGGGLIMVPILALLLANKGVSPEMTMHIAIGTSLAVVAMTSLSSTRAHHARGGVRWDLFKSFAPGLALGAVVGAIIADHLDGGSLEAIVGIGALGVALNMLIGKPPKAAAGGSGPRRIELFGVGSLIGTASSLIGIGGGSLTVPYLSLRGVEMRQAVGTSAAGGVPIAWAGALGFMVMGFGVPGLPPGQLGYISIAGFLSLATVSVLTAPLGARLAHQLPPTVLKRAFAVLLIVVGATMILG